ncbi:hypothetical protein HWV62_30663 [Athelia sp. TMB]|nr:hypothetical protein HWV62_30663 [Athelia sp. TMB]
MNVASIACLALVHAGIALAKGGGGGHSSGSSGSGGHSSSGGGHSSSGGHSSTPPSKGSSPHTIIITHTTNNQIVCYNAQMVRIKCPISKPAKIAIIVICSIVGALLLAGLAFWAWRRFGGSGAAWCARRTRSRGIAPAGVDDEEAHLQPQSSAYMPVHKHDDEKDDDLDAATLAEPPVYEKEEHLRALPSHPHFDEVKDA